MGCWAVGCWAGRWAVAAALGLRFGLWFRLWLGLGFRAVAGALAWLWLGLGLRLGPWLRLWLGLRALALAGWAGASSGLRLRQRFRLRPGCGSGLAARLRPGLAPPVVPVPALASGSIFGVGSASGLTHRHGGRCDVRPIQAAGEVEEALRRPRICQPTASARTTKVSSGNDAIPVRRRRVGEIRTEICRAPSSAAAGGDGVAQDVPCRHLRLSAIGPLPDRGRGTPGRSGGLNVGAELVRACRSQLPSVPVADGCLAPATLAATVCTECVPEAVRAPSFSGVPTPAPPTVRVSSVQPVSSQVPPIFQRLHGCAARWDHGFPGLRALFGGSRFFRICCRRGGDSRSVTSCPGGVSGRSTGSSGTRAGDRRPVSYGARRCARTAECAALTDALPGCDPAASPPGRGGVATAAPAMGRADIGIRRGALAASESVGSGRPTAGVVVTRQPRR